LADFDEALVDYLLGRPGIAVLVSRRIFPDYFPQDEQLPAIAYTLEDDSSQQIQQGPSGMRQAIYQINIWADTRREVISVLGIENKVLAARQCLEHLKVRNILCPFVYWNRKTEN